MLNVVNLEIKHLKELVRLGLEYFNDSRFSEDLKADTDVIHETGKACVVAPNVIFQVLEDEDGKLHGMVQAALIPTAWTKKLTCSINLIYVDECCKGKGHAEEFLTNVKEWAIANSCYEIITGDYAVDPERTGRWLGKQGYEFVGNHYGIKL